MKVELIKFETAKLLKDLSFDVTVDNSYWKNLDGNYFLDYGYECFSPDFLENTEHYAVPTQALLKKWLREKHNIHVSSFPVVLNRWYCTVGKIYEDKGMLAIIKPPFDPINVKSTYEEAFEVGLQEALKYIKNEHSKSNR